MPSKRKSKQSAYPPTLTARQSQTNQKRPSLILLLILQPAILLFSFLIITKPYLSPETGAVSRFHTDYFTILSKATPDLIIESLVRGLWGTLIIQTWFCARLSASLSPLLSPNQTRPKPFIRQLESVSLSLLSIPFTSLFIGGLGLFFFGFPFSVSFGSRSCWIFSFHFSLVVLLPLLDVLGVPFLSDESLWNQVYHLELPPPLLSIILIPCFTTSFFILLSSCISLALDWNRSWQTFPFACILSSFFGLAFGNVVVVCRLLFFQTKSKME